MVLCNADNKGYKLLLEDTNLLQRNILETENIIAEG